MITTQVCNYITQGLVQGRKYILKSVAQLAHIFQVLVAPINNITSPIHVGEQYSCYVCLDLKLMHALNSLFTGKCSFTVLSFELVSNKTTEANSACPSDQQTSVFTYPRAKFTCHCDLGFYLHCSMSWKSTCTCMCQTVKNRHNDNTCQTGSMSPGNIAKYLSARAVGCSVLSFRLVQH